MPNKYISKCIRDTGNISLLMSRLDILICIKNYLFDTSILLDKAK